jgi:GcrA cell cycle regulator
MSKKQNRVKTVETLESEDCRWPIGDPRHAGFHFCGANRLAGRPYCAEHWQMSFVPARSRHEQAAPALPIKQAA